MVCAAAVRLSTLGLQSFWYDEAFTPVHVLHPSLSATLSSLASYEKTPPLWDIVIWAWSRVFGTGEIAMRLPSALAGIATVPVAWAIGRELGGRVAAGARRVPAFAAAVVALNPLFVWYSQEARAYALFVLLAALTTLCFLRADAQPTRRRTAAFVAAAALTLLTHYFAVFLVAPMVVWLLRDRRRWPLTLPAAVTLAAVAAALVPLAVHQEGHGLEWIGMWRLASRVITIPQYYLTGYSGAPLGHTIEGLVALLILGSVAYGCRFAFTLAERRGILLMVGLAACGIGVPVALALVGADYLAPRNVVAAMIPLTAAVAVALARPATGRAGLALSALIVAAFAVLSVNVDLSPRVQRSDWRGIAQAIRSSAHSRRVITTVELGSSPLEYYLPPLQNLHAGQQVTVSEIDETGYPPLRSGAMDPPSPGFRLVASVDIHGLILYRFTSAIPRTVSQATLLRHVITSAHPEVLVRTR